MSKRGMIAALVAVLFIASLAVLGLFFVTASPSGYFVHGPSDKDTPSCTLAASHSSPKHTLTPSCPQHTPP